MDVGSKRDLVGKYYTIVTITHKSNKQIAKYYLRQGRNHIIGWELTVEIYNVISS